MTLTKVEVALLANTRDLLERLADAGSSELIKKFFKLNGLLSCLRKGAREDPDLVENLYSQLKDALSKGRTAKADRAARKRALDIEQDKRNLQVAKKIKVEHPTADEASSTTVTEEPGLHSEETNNGTGQPQEGRSVTNTTQSEDGRLGKNAGAGFHTNDATIGSGAASEASPKNPVGKHGRSEETRGLSKRPSTEPLQSGGYNGGVAPPAPQSPTSRPPSRGASNDEDGTNTSGTAPNALTSGAPALQVPTSRPSSRGASNNKHSTNSSGTVPNTLTSGAPALQIPTPRPPLRSTSNDEDGMDTLGTIPRTLTSKDTPSTAEPTSLVVVPGTSKSSTAGDQIFSSQSAQATGATIHQLAGLAQPRAAQSTRPLTAGSREQSCTARNPDLIMSIRQEITRQVAPKFASRIPSAAKREQDMEEILVMFERLNFWAIQYRLMTFGERRLRSPRVIAKIAELADKSDPVAVFRAIEASSATESDAKLHRVYGQVQLVKSIERKLGRIPGTTKADSFLSDMANNDLAKGESKHIRDKTLSKLRREYDAGRKWLQTIETFNGEGIVFIFVFASE